MIEVGVSLFSELQRDNETLTQFIDLVNEKYGEKIKHGIEKEWDSYKYETICEVVREWCEFHEIDYK